MKSFLSIAILFCTHCFAQYTVQGTLTETLKSDWVILYKIEGSQQKFVQNTKITTDTLLVDNVKKAISNFSFTLPKDTKIGAYRATYKLEGAGFVDFFFNKENIHFGFHPEYPNQSLQFFESKENKYYRDYLDAIAQAQHRIDSIQIIALKTPDKDESTAYKDAVKNANTIQKNYLKNTEDLYIKPFIEASFRTNSPELVASAKEYMSTLKTTFFDKIDFNNQTLLNSSFLIDRIADYVFFINYSDDAETQQKLFKESINTVLAKIDEVIFKKEVIQFLIEEFEKTKNITLIDFLFKNHYDKLSKGVKNEKYKADKLALFNAEIGRIAPDFSWKESGKSLTLSKLNDAETYILVFWSTGCSHCLREIPQLHQYLENKNNIKVVALSLENDDIGWSSYKQNLPNWHHVLGLNKWENKVARTYNIMSTPSYFVLDTNKKIIAKPDTFKDVKSFIEE